MRPATMQELLRPTTKADFQLHLLLSRPQAANALGVSPRTVSILKANGELPHVRIGGRVLYSIDDLQKFIDAHRNN